MKGSIIGRNTKNGKRYYIVVDLPVAPGEKRKQKWIAAGTNKREAEKLLPKVLLKFQSYTNNDHLLFQDVTHDYLYKAQHSLAKSTYKRYLSCSKILNQEFGKYPLVKITPYMISQFFKELQKKDYTPASIQKYKSVIKQIFLYAVELKIIDVSPVPKYTIKSSNSEDEHKTWTTQQIFDFLNHVKGQPIYLPVLLAASTGMRCGEIVGLKWKDINFTTNTIHVVRSKTFDDTLKSPKTKSSKRPIHLMDHVVAELKAYQLWQKKNRIKYGKDYHKSDFVCTLEDGTPLNTNYISKTFPRKVIKYKFEPIRFHDLRHSFATIALSNGIHAKVVQEILGHSSIKVTLDTYSHVIPTMHSDSMDKLNQAFMAH